MFLHKLIYDITLEIRLFDSGGRGRMRRFGERVGLSAQLPVGEADVLVPVLNDTVSMTLFKAEGVLGFYRDNDLFGWTPPAPKARKWEFQIGAIPKKVSGCARFLQCR